MQFQLESRFKPTGDQPEAIKKLVAGLQNKKRHQTLLGVTGSGKTFTMANVIEQVQKPTLIIAHNKTLAAQLYQEFRDFFPNNAVSYFVSYYDYYQPEAYIPTTDTYIEKEATINDEIDKLRLSSSTNLLTRPDSIVVASVSCIYNLGSPVEYGKYILELIIGQIISRETMFLQLANLQYERATTEFKRGSYRIRGEVIQIWPASEDKALRVETLGNTISDIKWIDPISGSVVVPNNTAGYGDNGSGTVAQRKFIIYPAKHYMMDPKSQGEAMAEIRHDLGMRIQELKAQNKIVEAYRLEQKVNYDLERIQEFGFVNGIENYSRYFDGRKEGEPPYSLIEYFIHNAKEFGDGSFLTIVDESHITLPQIRGMYNGDRARKQTLIEYGFRLPSALDNRPLKFDEFMDKTDLMTYVSATPNELEINLSEGQVVEQLIRPTGLIDPTIELRPIAGQIEDLVIEIIKRKQQGERTLVTTLTKKMAEALTEYLNDTKKIDMLVKSYLENIEKKQSEETVFFKQEDLPIKDMEIGIIEEKYMCHLKKLETNQNRSGFTAYLNLDNLAYPKVAYLHSDIETLDRSDILDDLRRGEYDVLVGINLLREGLDLPEVSLVAILDADKEGFLRSRTSLIQTMGRAARHSAGHTILYADKLTGSMKFAIEETLRRRKIQIEHNLKMGISPESINKPIREKMIDRIKEDDDGIIRDFEQKNSKKKSILVKLNKGEQIDISKIDPEALTPYDKKNLTSKLRRAMNDAAKDMDFELAAIIRDKIKELG